MVGERISVFEADGGVEFYVLALRHCGILAGLDVD